MPLCWPFAGTTLVWRLRGSSSGQAGSAGTHAAAEPFPLVLPIHSIHVTEMPAAPSYLITRHLALALLSITPLFGCLLFRRAVLSPDNSILHALGG
eukprot:559741-Pleurochrysis_carterae.AAC.2